MHRTEEQLIRDHLSGDSTAFGVLLHRWLRPVHNFVRTRIRNEAEAEDITQEAFLKLWKNLLRYREGESFKAWLFAIVRNTVIDALRKKKDVSFSELDPEEDGSFAEGLVDGELLPDALFEKAENARRLTELVRELSPLHQEVLFLYYNEEMTFAEIGKALKAPLDTVKSRHRRALETLRKKLSSQGAPFEAFDA